MNIVFNKSKEVDINKRVYQCHICNKLFNWDNHSSWYGSDEQSENNPESIPYFCSDECLNEFSKNV